MKIHPKLNAVGILKTGGAAIAIIALALGYSWTLQARQAAAATPTEERSQLEQQLAQLEREINQNENLIGIYQKQGKTLSGEIGKLNAKISKINLQIQAVRLAIEQLNQQIGETQNKIGVTEQNIESNKTALSGLLLNLSQTESGSVLELFLKSQDFSDFFNDVNNLTQLQDNLRVTTEQIIALRDQLKTQKDQLVLARADAATIEQAQQQQRVEAEQVKLQKNSLLVATKGQESRYQQIVNEKKAMAAQIRQRIFQLVGGGQMTFEQAYKLAKYAADATGVRPALLLAVLDRESALGMNVGKCSYQTAMNPKDQPLFIALTMALNMNPSATKVSCPNADGVYGGAMGPAQFIPSTWNKYQGRISAITGNSPANPWSNLDAFVASALYLRDAGAASNERMAAAKYYCGASWQRYVCTEVYGRKVIEHAAQFEEDIAAITQ